MMHSVSGQCRHLCQLASMPLSLTVDAGYYLGRCLRPMIKEYVVQFLVVCIMNTGFSRRRLDTGRYHGGARKSFVPSTGERTVKANTLIAKRLHALAELYQQGQVSDLMDRPLEKLLHHEAEACQVQLSQLQADLAEFEQKYDLSSTTFYQQFQAV